jgi:hypothetical protein
MTLIFCACAFPAAAAIRKAASRTTKLRGFIERIPLSFEMAREQIRAQRLALQELAGRRLVVQRPVRKD